MKLGLLQIDIQWEDVNANIERVRSLLQQYRPGDFDMLVLPELWSCGFTMNSAAHETYDAGISFMQDLSVKLQCSVLGGLPFKTDTGQENRCYLVEGDVQRHYAKIKAFKFAGEHERYEQGNQKRRWKVGGFQLSPFICYDLRFPELARAMVPETNLLSYVACWPKVREMPWRQLLRARAIENLCYVIGVNRVGKDAGGLEYSGASMVIGPLGEVVLDAGHEEGLFKAEIDPAQVKASRQKFRFLDDM